MSAFIRTSKFRHIYGDPYKKELCYENVAIIQSTWDSNFCDINEKFLAVCVSSSGGGSFLALPIELCGKISPEYPKVCGHQGTVLDIAWNPFNSNMIASASEDCFVRIWIIPDGGLKEDLEEPALILRGHTRKVGQVVWHPTTADVIFSSSTDNTIRAWNIKTGSEIKRYEGHSDMIYNFSFNEDASQFVTTCKDKKIRIFDTHSQTIVFEAVGHEGPKSSRCIFLDNNRIITTGFSRNSDRQYKLWSNTLEQIVSENIDIASGLIIPFYDSDLKILYLAGKGDGNIRYYEITDVAPFVHFLDNFKSNKAQKALGFLPKRALNTSICEIARFYKLHQSMIEPIAMIVPRKSDLFQDDIYPECVGDIPSLQAQDFINGISKMPIRISLKEGFVSAKMDDYVPPVTINSSESSCSKNSNENLIQMLNEKVKYYEEELSKKDKIISQLESQIQNN